MTRRNIKADYILWLIVFISVVAGYLSGTNEKPLFYAAMLILAALPSVGMVMLDRGLKLPTEYVVSISIAILLILLAAIVNNYFSLNYVVLVFIISSVCYGVSAKPQKSRLLVITNAIYVIYLILSVFIHFGVIAPYRDATMFEYDEINLFGSPFKAFAGFYGSAATIDSYSIFVALINLFFNRSIVLRLVMIGVCIIAAVATLRFTPFIALVLAALGAACWSYIGNRKVRAVYVFALTLFIFTTPIIAVFIVDYYGLDSLYLLDKGTSGRASIWLAMVLKFFSFNNSLDTIVLGSSDTLEFAADLGFSDDHLVENPHNNYLSFLIKYGVIGWLFLLCLFYFVLRTLKKAAYFLVALFVMLTGITNNETFGIYYPIYLIWFGAFHAYSRIIYSHKPFGSV